MDRKAIDADACQFIESSALGTRVAQSSPATANGLGMGRDRQRARISPHDLRMGMTCGGSWPVDIGPDDDDVLVAVFLLQACRIEVRSNPVLRAIQVSALRRSSFSADED
jgi:hypothetical protein